MAAGRLIPSIPWPSITFDRDAEGERVVLGDGAHCRVYAATLRGEPIALKCTLLTGKPPALAASLAAAFWREAELHYRLRNEHIVPCEGAAEKLAPGGAVSELGLAMARMPRTLADWLEAAPPPPSRRGCARSRALRSRCATCTRTTPSTAT